MYIRQECATLQHLSTADCKARGDSDCVKTNPGKMGAAQLSEETYIADRKVKKKTHEKEKDAESVFFFGLKYIYQ